MSTASDRRSFAERYRALRSRLVDARLEVPALPDMDGIPPTEAEQEALLAALEDSLRAHLAPKRRAYPSRRWLP